MKAGIQRGLITTHFLLCSESATGPTKISNHSKSYEGAFVTQTPDPTPSTTLQIVGGVRSLIYKPAELCQIEGGSGGQPKSNLNLVSKRDRNRNRSRVRVRVRGEENVSGRFPVKTKTRKESSN